jgi:hypothetical protein
MKYLGTAESEGNGHSSEIFWDLAVGAGGKTTSMAKEDSQCIEHTKVMELPAKDSPGFIVEVCYSTGVESS